MEFFRDTQIDFMKYRRHWIMVSVVMILVSIMAIFVHGKLNFGIDFAGGTQLTIKFRDEPEIDALRDIVGQAGIRDAQIQRFGDTGANEVIIKTAMVAGLEEGSREPIVTAIDDQLNADRGGRFDLNQSGREALADELQARDPESLVALDAEAAGSHYHQVADAIMRVRQQDGLLHSWDEFIGDPAIGPEVLALLREEAYLGSFAVVGAGNVSPQIGAEIREKGILAVIFSLIGILAYIWFRFELRFGIGALVAVTHDVFVVLGLFALAGFEFNLTTIAAFLTLVGYSVNDTVVIFDRVRENMRRHRREPMVKTINLSLNQTLSRTVLTSGTTLVAVGSLLVLGGDVLRGFGFILTIGVVVGTYSSIYIASPFTVLWEKYFGREARAQRREART